MLLILYKVLSQPPTMAKVWFIIFNYTMQLDTPQHPCTKFRQTTPYPDPSKFFYWVNWIHTIKNFMVLKSTTSFYKIGMIPSQLVCISNHATNTQICKQLARIKQAFPFLYHNLFYPSISSSILNGATFPLNKHLHAHLALAFLSPLFHLQLPLVLYAP